MNTHHMCMILIQCGAEEPPCRNSSDSPWDLLGMAWKAWNIVVQIDMMC